MSANPLNINLHFSRKSGLYRYSFQRQEVSKEYWEGAVEFKYRVEDARLGRFFSVDPLFAKYPFNSNYAFSENRLIDGVELEGLEYQKANGDFAGPYNEKYAKDNQATLEPRFQEEKQPKVEPNLSKQAVNAQPKVESSTSKRQPITYVVDHPTLSSISFDANLSVESGFAALGKSALGGRYNYGGATVVGVKDNKTYLAGENLQTGKREVNIEKSFQFIGGAGYSEVRENNLNGSVLKKTTSFALSSLYYERTVFNSGMVTEDIGITAGFSIGIGLVINCGFKVPCWSSTTYPQP